MKTGTETKLKFKSLMRELALEEWECRGLLDALWTFTEHNAPAGNIGRFSDEQIAVGIGCARIGAQKLIEALILCAWIDKDRAQRLLVHGWYEHCEGSVHRKLAFAKEFFATGEVPKLTRLTAKEKEDAEAWYSVHTPDVRRTNKSVRRKPCRAEPLPSQAKPSQANAPAPDPSAAAPPVVFSFEDFWQAFPSGRKQGKERARAAWSKAIKVAPPETIIAAAREYAASPVGQGQFVKGPEPWLNGHCWDDDRLAWQRKDETKNGRHNEGLDINDLDP